MAMNKEMYEPETRDVLSRRWWPGQWLRLVWSVWVDQKWYWQVILPRLRDRKQGREILIQVSLGTVLISLALSLVVNGVLGIAGMQMSKEGLYLNVAGVIAVPVLSALSALWRFKGKYAIPGTPTMGLHFTVFTLSGVAIESIIKANTMGQGTWGLFVTFLSIFIVNGIVLGVSNGVLYGVRHGARSQTLFIKVLPWMTVYFFGGGDFIAERATRGIAILCWIVMILIAGFATHLGVHWTTRQVPDDQTRMQLANPEVYWPMFPRFGG